MSQETGSTTPRGLRRRFEHVATVVLVVGTVPFLPACNRPAGGEQTAGRAATVTGHLLRVGGPAGAEAAGLPGKVRFQAEGGEVVTASTVSDGSFSITVRPGRYVVTGTSPLIGDGTDECRPEKSVEVIRTDLSDVEVICSVR